MLAAVEAIRAAFPPDGAAGASHHPPRRRREEALSWLDSLAELLSAPATPPLLPLQFEVLFRQLVHMLSVVRAWEASGTAEEALRAVLGCLEALMKVPLVAADTGELLSAPALRASTGQALSELLLTASAHPAPVLRAACLRAVSRVCSPPASAAGLEPDVLAFFLPGVASQLARLCSEDEKTRDSLRLAVLDALGALLRGTLRDELNRAALRAASPEGSAERLRMLQEEARKPRSAEGRGAHAAAAAAAVATAEPARQLRVERTPAWLEATASRLSSALGVVSSCCLRGGWRARHGLVRLLAELLRHSGASLRPCAPVVLDTLCGCMRDPHPRVATAARAALVRAAGRRAGGGASALMAQLGEGFDRRLGSLPAATRAASSAPVTRALRVLASQLELLAVGGGLAPLLATRLGALTSALLAVCRMDVPPAAVEQRLPYRLRGAAPRQAAEQLRHMRYSAKPFGVLRDPPAVRAMRQLCRLLGRHAPLPALVHQLCHVVLTATRDADAEATAPLAPAATAAMPPPPAEEGGAARRVVAVGGAALPRAEALWILDEVLLGAGAELERTTEAAGGSEAPRCEAFASLDDDGEADGGEADGAVVIAAEAAARQAARQAAARRAEEEAALAALRAEAATFRAGAEAAAAAGRAQEAAAERARVLASEAAARQQATVVAAAAKAAATAAAAAQEAAAAAAAAAGGEAGEGEEEEEEEEEEEGEEEGMEEEEEEAIVEEEAAAAEEEEEECGPSAAAMGVARAAGQLRAAEAAAREECVLMLLGELLRPGVWHGAASWRGGDGVAARRGTLLEHELLLQVVGSASALLRRAEGAQVALRLALFPVLERLGDESTLLAHAAELTLCRLCVAPPRAESVRGLLARNGDFLLDALAQRLRRAAWHPHTPQVVQAVLEFAGAETLPLLADIVDELLRLVDDAADGAGAFASPAAHGAPALLPCLRALHALVLAARDFTPAAEPHGAARPAPGEDAAAAAGHPAGGGAEGADSSDDEADALGEAADRGAGGAEGGLASFFDDLLRSAEEEDDEAPGAPRTETAWGAAAAAAAAADAGAGQAGEAEEAEADEESAAAQQRLRAEEDEAEEERRATPPLGPSLALSVLGKAEALLLCGSAAAAHALLGSLEAALPLLAPWPRALLPALHKLWPPLFALMAAADLSVAAHAMAVLRAAVRQHGDALAARTLRDALGPLLDALRRHGAPPDAPAASPPTALAAAAAAAAAPPASLAHRLVLSAARTLGALCTVRRAMQPEALRLLRAAAPLLSSRQPAAVQQAGLRLCRRLVRINRDAVWLYWLRVVPPPHWRDPPARLRLERPAVASLLPACPAPAAEYAHNAALLLAAVHAHDRRLARRALGKD